MMTLCLFYLVVVVIVTLGDGWWRCHRQLKAERAAVTDLIDIAVQNASRHQLAKYQAEAKAMGDQFKARMALNTHHSFAAGFRAGQDHILKQAHVIVRADELRTH